MEEEYAYKNITQDKIEYTKLRIETKKLDRIKQWLHK